MPGWFVASIVTFVSFLIALLVALATRKAESPDGKETHEVASGLAVLLLILTGVFTLVSSWNPVSTKNEGIELSFGKTSGHLSNGAHFTAPWVKVVEMDAAIQTDQYSSPAGNWNTALPGNGANASGPCLPVRLANQQTGCVDVTIRWRIQPGAADELYKDYRSFEHVRNSLVTKDLVAAANTAFADFNPLDSIRAKAAPSNGTSNPTLATLAGRIRNTLADENRGVGSRIDVLSVIIPLVLFDPATQSRINQLQQQVALTRIAEQALQTNRKQAEANAALEARGLTTNVLVAQCMAALSASVKDGHPLPPGFSCWPGGSGASTAVLAPATGKSK